MAYTTIDDPSAHFYTFLYRGDSTSTTTADRTLTNDANSNLQPDLIAIWNRDSTTNSGARWYDSTRGVGQNKGLQSSSTGAEGLGNDPEFGYVNTIHSDGFGVRAGANDANGRWTTDRGEGGGDKYVAYQWKANGGSTTSVSESGSGDGAINACTYQANTTAGFSIIKYTGLNNEISNNQHTKVTHGLGIAPTVVIIKNIQSGESVAWQVLGTALGGPRGGGFNDYHLHFNATSSRSGTNHVGSTAPDTNYIYVGNHEDVNDDGKEYILYAFADIQGFSKFSTFKGNGATNGIFCHTGFKPGLVIIKNIEQTEPWVMFDSKRNPSNLTNKKLGIHSYYAENSVPQQGDAQYNNIDIVSNGFKLRTNNGATNVNDKWLCYWAWAEEPFVTSTGVPATAR